MIWLARSKIEWTDWVWNPITGCSKISPGCDNCYAERMSKRFAETWGLPADDPFKVTLHPERLEQPLRWTKPSKVFVCSMADLFHDEVPFSFIEKVFREVVYNEQHTFMMLTKRPERLLSEQYWEDADPPNGDWSKGVELTYKLLPWPKNLWLGVTAENQEQADKRIPILLQIPAAQRFVSVEPMLSEVKILNYLGEEVKWNCHGDEISRRNSLDWVICGGESGPGARPMHPEWARSIREQCKAAGVPFFFKQFGEWWPIGGDGISKPEYDDQFPKTPYCWVTLDGNVFQSGASPDALMLRTGKKSAGSILDGQEWKQFPGVMA